MDNFEGFDEGDEDFRLLVVMLAEAHFIILPSPNPNPNRWAGMHTAWQTTKPDRRRPASFCQVGSRSRRNDSYIYFTFT